MNELYYVEISCFAPYGGEDVKYILYLHYELYAFILVRQEQSAGSVFSVLSCFHLVFQYYPNIFSLIIVVIILFNLVRSSRCKTNRKEF